MRPKLLRTHAITAIISSAFVLGPGTHANAQPARSVSGLAWRPSLNGDQVSDATASVSAPRPEFPFVGAVDLSAPLRKRAPWWAPAASLVVPGAGQALLGQQRSVAYLVTEGYLLVQVLGVQRDVTNSVRDYQAIAANAARKNFGGTFPVGPWPYYEEMENEKFIASGAFDLVPGGAVDPETDPTTYNGDSWKLARTTYWNDPNIAPPITSLEYQRALAFYTKRAVREEFRWSWRDAGLQRDVYRQTIAAANRSNQRKTNLVTIVGANHLASLIDAYVTVRIRRYGGAGIAGLRMDGITTNVAAIGDPANGQRSVRTQLRFVPRANRVK